MRSAEHVARLEDLKNAFKILVGSLKGRENLEDQDIDGRIILK
jgi:hypothetical protein